MTVAAAEGNLTLNASRFSPRDERPNTKPNSRAILDCIAGRLLEGSHVRRRRQLLAQRADIVSQGLAVTLCGHDWDGESRVIEHDRTLIHTAGIYDARLYITLCSMALYGHKLAMAGGYLCRRSTA